VNSHTICVSLQTGYLGKWSTNVVRDS